MPAHEKEIDSVFSFSHRLPDSCFSPAGQPRGDREDRGNTDAVKKDGSDGLIVGFSICAVLLVAAVFVFLIYRKQSRDSNEHPAESEIPLQT